MELPIELIVAVCRRCRDLETQLSIRATCKALRLHLRSLCCGTNAITFSETGLEWMRGGRPFRRLSWGTGWYTMLEYNVYGRLALHIKASGYRTARSSYSGSVVETVTTDALNGDQSRKVLFVGAPPCVIS